MKLEIISPERSLYSGDAEMATFPGLKGAFTILNRHAPIISGLNRGTIVFRHGGKEERLEISGGFVEANNDHVIVCID